MDKKELIKLRKSRGLRGFSNTAR